MGPELCRAAKVGWNSKELGKLATGLERSKGPRNAGALLLDHFEESLRLAVLKALVTATLDLLGLGEVTLRPLHSFQSSHLVQAWPLCLGPCQGGKVDRGMGGGSLFSHS